MKQVMKLMAVVAGVGLLVACNAGQNQTNIELIQDMMDQPSIKSQDGDPEYAGGAMRTPPEGTVPRGQKPLLVKDPVQASQLKNPFAGDQSPAVIEFGKKTYDVYCMVCHGARGAGDGTVADKMLIMKPPSLLTPKVKDYSDGRIYFIISQGQGLMGSYANQITDERARWAVVNYIRNLQRN